MKNRIFLVAVCLAVFIFCTACGAEKPEMESSGLPKVCVNDDIGQMNHIKYAENSDELIEGNPWSESLGITELPVFETRLYQNGEFHSENGFSQEEAVERARQIAEALHLTVDNIDTSSYNPDMSKEYAMIKADCGDAVINIGLGGMKYIQYQKNPLELPAGYEFDPRSEVQTEKAANWLIEKYSKPLGIENPKFFVRKEYGQNGSCLHNVGVYSQNENSVNTLLSYNFSPWFFQPEIVVDVEKNEPSYSGRLSAIVCEGRLDLMHEIANYPIISIDEARNELLSGNFYFAEDNDESLCPKNEDIACVELIYDTTECEVSIPYYRFWVSVSQDYIDQHMHEFSEKSIEAGVMPYFSFYVPAIQSNYLDNVYDYSINEDCTLDSFFAMYQMMDFSLQTQRFQEMGKSIV